MIQQLLTPCYAWKARFFILIGLLCPHLDAKLSLTVGPVWQQSENSFLPVPNGVFLQQNSSVSRWNLGGVAVGALTAPFSEHVTASAEIGYGFLRHGRGEMRADIEDLLPTDVRQEIAISANGVDVGLHLSFAMPMPVSIKIKWLIGCIFGYDAATITILETIRKLPQVRIFEKAKSKGAFVGISAEKELLKNFSVDAEYICTFAQVSVRETFNVNTESSLQFIGTISNSIALGAAYTVSDSTRMAGRLLYSITRNNQPGMTIGFEDGEQVSQANNWVRFQSQGVSLVASCLYEF